MLSSMVSLGLEVAGLVIFLSSTEEEYTPQMGRILALATFAIHVPSALPHDQEELDSRQLEVEEQNLSL